MDGNMSGHVDGKWILMRLLSLLSSPAFSRALTRPLLSEALIHQVQH